MRNIIHTSAVQVDEAARNAAAIEQLSAHAELTLEDAYAIQRESLGLRFKRGESDEIIDLKLKLLPETVARLRELYDKTRFLESEENYQDKKDHSNLGWVTLTFSAGGRERSARFNYTPNLDIKQVQSPRERHRNLFEMRDLSV